MADFAVLCEFDIHKGCVIRGLYPERADLRTAEFQVASYMLPDGTHNRQTDKTFFTLTLEQTPEAYFEDHKALLTREAFPVEAYILDHVSKSWMPMVQGVSKRTLSLEAITRFALIGSESEAYPIEVALTSPPSVVSENFLSFESEGGPRLSLRFPEGRGFTIVHNYLKTLAEWKAKGKDKLRSAYNFFNIICNRKDSAVARGATVRALALASNKINVLFPLEPLVTEALVEVMELPPVWQEDKRHEEVQKILGLLYDQTNSLLHSVGISIFISDCSSLNFRSNSILRRFSSGQKKVDLQWTPEVKLQLQFDLNGYSTLTPVSLSKFVRTFREKTMTIYRAILEGKRIIFVGGPQLMFQELAEYVSACNLLVAPLGITDRTFPFVHLIDMAFLDQKSYIIGVTNPLFVDKKAWWDVCCDVLAGTVKVNTPPTNSADEFLKKAVNSLQETKIKALDVEFIEEVLKRLGGDDTPAMDERIEACFYNYTKHQLDYWSNQANLVDFEREEKALVDAFNGKAILLRNAGLAAQYETHLDSFREDFKSFFGEEYVEIYRTFNSFVENDEIDDYELILNYTTLNKHLVTDAQLEFFLRLYLKKKQNIENLMVGLYAHSESILERAMDFLVKVEANKIGNFLMSKTNYFMLFLFQNMKNQHIHAKKSAPPPS
eukprot:TRINITY_DN4505_c0_g1_i13.p1 TRINITY_DN4505_c0_g1~~TRINITY_DN4505_c0_g1_i13.p1  ORF type:complete len:664 (-),score=127.36 TRINITY_DN4505_c0_g1_i13:116-2107(-)